jgi:hypothetical protein
LAAEDREINFLLAAHPEPDYVAYGGTLLSKASNLFLARHPAIGQHSDFPQLEAFPHPLDNRP